MMSVQPLTVQYQQKAPVLSSSRGLQYTDIESAWRMATAFFESGMVPANLTAKAKNPVAAVFTAMQLGAEVGLTPLASIQNIAVINGKPGPYGTGMLAVVEASGKLESIKEWFDGDGDKRVAYCEVKRIGRDAKKQSFSLAEAKSAKLLDKDGPWKTYPDRMLAARARTFVLRDVFPDVLLGLSHSAEELNDIPAKDITPASLRPESAPLAPASPQPVIDLADESESFEIIDEVGTVIGSVTTDKLVETIIQNIKASSLPAVGKSIANNNMATIDMLIGEKRLDPSVKAEIEAAIPVPQPAPAPAPVLTPAPQPVAATPSPSPERIELDAIRKAITEVTTVEALKALQLEKQDFLHKLVEIGGRAQWHANDVFAKFDARREALEAADAISDEPESII